MRAIYVDDELLSIRKFKQIFEMIKDNDELTCFSNPLEALQFAHEQEIDIAFLDIEMPELTGVKLCEKLKEIRPDTRVIFVTGYEQYALKAFEVRAQGYLLKPYTQSSVRVEMELARKYQDVSGKKQVFIKTFGRFDVFVNGVAVKFSNAKAKEFLALLVDRNGGTVSMDQAITFLWENRQYDDNVKSRYRAMLKSLRDTLENAGIAEILVDNRNNRCVNKTKFECDYYQLLKNDNGAVLQYNGEYMFEYSWAEATSMRIDRILQKQK